ncbi:hypothetical protein IMSAGC004_03440 [Bacteroidaceae bacterium]|nr:hypothetical protein IMSAGC004_03440 [Bacteroidaceae bacterium]
MTDLTILIAVIALALWPLAFSCPCKSLLIGAIPLVLMPVGCP